MNPIADILILAYVNKALVDHLKLMADNIPWVAKNSWLWLPAAFVTGTGLSLGFGLNILPVIAPSLSQPVLGMVLTGLSVGAGANFIHDLTDKPH